MRQGEILDKKKKEQQDKDKSALKLEKKTSNRFAGVSDGFD